MSHSRVGLLASVLTTTLLVTNHVLAQGLVTGGSLPVLPLPAGDVDGDGVADYVGRLTGTVLSGATGVAIPYLTRPVTGFEDYRAVGDLNSDGHDDLVWLTAAGLALAISGADGSTLFTMTSSSPTASGFTGAIGGADFDSDGFGDAVLLVDRFVEIRSGRTGQKLHGFDANSSLFAQVSFFVGDTNGDGFSDVAVAHPLGTLRIIRGPAFAETVFAQGSPLAIGDVNGNGATDRTFRNTSTNVTQVIDGASGLALGTVVGLITGKVTPMGDVDGDGHADFFVFQPGQSLPPMPALIDIISGATLAALPGGPAAVVDSFYSIGVIDGDGRDEGWAMNQSMLVQWVDPALPVVSRMTRRGAAGTRSSGSKLRLDTRGSCALGKTLFFDTRGTAPGDIVLLLYGPAQDVDLAPSGAPGNHLYVDFVGGVVSLATGAVVVQSFTMPSSTSLLGATLSLQSAAVDPAANTFGYVGSNAIDIVTNN